MPESVIIQLITTGGFIIAAILGNKKLNGIRDDARTSAVQTANDHDTNLRDDVTDLGHQIDAVKGSVLGLSAELRRIVPWLRDLTAADLAIESTVDRKAAVAARELVRAQDENEARIENLRHDLERHIREHGSIE